MRALPLLLSFLCSAQVFALTETNPLEKKRPLAPGQPRWLEDYRFLDAPQQRTDPIDSLRYTRLGENTWLQLGGEIRYRGDSVNRPLFGLTPVQDDSFLQQRLQVHADLHLFDDALRTFVQLENTRAWGKDLQTPRDESGNDIHQAFIESKHQLGRQQLGLRVGRQEMAYGAQALVTYAETPNIRQTFEGVRFTLGQAETYRIDAFYTHPVRYDKDDFDDSADDNSLFYGLYSTFEFDSRTGIDLYAIGLEQKSRKLLGTQGADDRYTLGTRIFGAHAGFDWSWDLMSQQGHFAHQKIEAWGIWSNTGYTFDTPWRVRLGLRADAASGDKDSNDGKAGTFDPLFPRNGVYGEAALTTFANLIAVGPVIGFSPHPLLRIEPGVLKLWRESTHDAVYLPGMQTVAGTASLPGKDIGTAYLMTARWLASQNLTLDLDLEFFDAASVITRAGGEDSSLIALRTTLRF